MGQREIAFVCTNSVMDEGEWQLKLPYPFFTEYGCRLPIKVHMEFPSGEVCFGKYKKGSQYIHGLEEMMSFYGIRPYHMVLLRYFGKGYFKLNVFNECAVEICYPLSSATRSKVRRRQNDPFVDVMSNNQISEIEIQKLGGTFGYNAVTNFLLCHDIIIQREHLVKHSKYEVMSCKDLKKLGLEKGKKEMEICFQRSKWTIKFMTKEGLVFFNEGWFVFLTEANLSEGDVCVIVRTGYDSRFKIAVLPKNLLSQWSSTGDNRIAIQRFSWFKILRGMCLGTGNVEMPRLFRMKFGTELGRKILLSTSDGRVFKAKYSFQKNRLSGLKKLISAYDIYHNCMLVFEYVGHSEFKVSIFDSQNVDHLKEITGEFVADIVKEMQMYEAEDGNVNEEENEDYEMDEEVEEDDVVLIEEGVEYCRVKGEGKMAFLVKLQKSHFQKKGRGAYCSPLCYEMFKKWTCRTIINLQFEGSNFQVGVHRNNRSCRFGRGWDQFISKSKLSRGQLLEFRFINQKTIQVIRKM